MTTLPIDEFGVRHSLAGPALVVSINFDGDLEAAPFLDHEIAVSVSTPIIDEMILGAYMREIYA